MDKCSICDLTHLPLCLGQQDPSACPPATPGIRYQRSLWLSSQLGWPALVAVAEPADGVGGPAEARPAETAPVLVASYRRGKPVVPLGFDQRRSMLSALGSGPAADG